MKKNRATLYLVALAALVALSLGAYRVGSLVVASAGSITFTSRALISSASSGNLNFYASNGTTPATLNAADAILSSPTGVDAVLGSIQANVSATNSHTIYTVPSGKTAVVTRVVIRSCSASLDQTTDPVFSVGCNATDYNNIVAGATYTTPSATTGVVTKVPAAESAICAAAATLKVNVTTGSTNSTTCYFDAIGYLF